MELNARELATVLAALRFWQRTIETMATTGGPRWLSPEHFRDDEPLDTAEIDDLCERLNCGPSDSALAMREALAEVEAGHTMEAAAILRSALEIEPGPWTVADISGAIRCNPESTAYIVRACNAYDDLLAALKSIMDLYYPTSLEACAYQGPPGKKWIKEQAPILDAKVQVLAKVQAIARAAIARAEKGD